MTSRPFLRPMPLAVLFLGVVGAGHAMGQADTIDTDGDGSLLDETAQWVGGSGLLFTDIQADVSGTITGVRILEHRETPGLGDGIEVRPDDRFVEV